MQQRAREVRPAAAARDAGYVRLRRATQVSVSVTVVLGGVFAALAAGSTHPKKASRLHVQAPVRRAISLQAPAPPLVAAASPAPSPSAAPTPAPAAPTPSYQPPVVVSGGS